MGRKREESRGREGVEETKGGEGMGRVGGNGKREGGRKGRKWKKGGREERGGDGWGRKMPGWVQLSCIHVCVDLSVASCTLHSTIPHVTSSLCTQVHTHTCTEYGRTLSRVETQRKSSPLIFRGVI